MEKLIIPLLVFLVPTQLGLHFWPEWAYVFGIRSDFLSPTLYLTDVLVLSLFFPFVFFQRRKVHELLGRELLVIFLIFVVNLVTSQNILISLFKWIRVFEFYFLFKVLVHFFKKNSETAIFRSLCLSIIVFSAIGFLQMVLGHTIGGSLYFFGERSFSVDTPGISTAFFLGKEILRPYSTFGHPNAFAGYMLVSVWIMVFLAKRRDIKKSPLLLIAVISAIVAIFLSFSRVAIAGLLLSFGLSLVSRARFALATSAAKLVLIALVIASLLSPFFVKDEFFVFDSRISERIELAKAAMVVFSNNPFGVGLGNSISEISKISILHDSVWKLQPVHNIYLLTLLETGVIGLWALILFLIKALFSITKRNVYLLSGLFVIIFTGVFDHYWVTLQQNQLLLVILFSLIFSRRLSTGPAARQPQGLSAR